MSEEELQLYKEIIYADKVFDINFQNISKKLYKEIERLNNIIRTGIEAINIYQNEKTLSVGYQDLKIIRGILQGNEIYLKMFEEYLQELKRSNKEWMI